MNIESTNIKKINETQTSTTNKTKEEDTSVKFADELKNVVKEEKIEENTSEKARVDKISNKEEKEQDKTSTQYKNIERINSNTFKTNKLNSDKTLNCDKENDLNVALKDMSSIIKEFNQSEDNTGAFVKEKEFLTDNTNDMINNDFNIQENKDLAPQINLNMNFSGDGQPFSSFLDNKKDEKREARALSASAQDLAEEAAILSTMAENIAIANKNQVLKDTKIVMDEEGIKKVNVKTNIKVEDIVKYDSIIMNQADVEVFTNLVEKGEVDLRNLTPKAAEKSVQISKTLADILAKSMENNQPVRINFDNNISVIIRISRDGKITADFLPSSQVAEAYLKENLPLLRQKFDDSNIDYELNQRERREHNRDNNKKKDRNNE